MQRIGPGIYVDGAGAMHFDAQGLCEHLNVQLTPENVAIAKAAALEAFLQNFPDVGITHLDDATGVEKPHGRD